MTEAPLRAFLMVRSRDGTWTVTVCRDFGAVMRAWKTRKEPDRDVAVLHVGFDRPPSHSFDEVAEAHPGRMLLTAAAKHGVPTSFVSSAAPVGAAESIDVFIGLQGWGYTLDDPTAGADRVEPPRPDTVIHEPQGWVASFRHEHPSDAETVSAHGIFDDATYLDREAELERSVRHRAGLFRLHHIVGANCKDPCELARAAPPWLAAREMASLELSVRADNVFRVVGIKTVRDLADWSPDALLAKRNFGRKSLRDTLRALTGALNDGPLRAAMAEAVPDSDRLLTEVRRSLLTFSDRERDVLNRRLGFETPPETLQEVADDYGITRERIRQIEAHTTEKWMRVSSWDDILEQKISRLLIGRSFPLPVAGVEAIDAWFEGVSEHRVFFRNLVQTVCGDRIHMVPIDGLYYFSLMAQETWERTVSEASALLSSGAGREWSEDYARSLVHGLLPDTAKEFGTLLWDKSSRLCHFSVAEDGSRILTSYGRGADHLVEAILAESDTPLHYTEIAERARIRDGRSLDARLAHSAAANVGFLFARGTYGLTRHVPLSDEQMLQIRGEAEDIVCSEAPGRQWHSSEILSEISERMEGGFDGLDKYVLDIALAGSEMLKPLGKMTWVAAAADTDDQSRIDVHQAVVAIVQAAGHPLSTSEIKERLTAVRGVNEFFQILPIDPLIRMQPGMWGINDRDVSISREEQRELVEKLVHILDEKQYGIHASELCGALPLQDCPLDAFLSIASQDERLKIAQGRYVYFAEWKSPRRETIAHAVSGILEGSGRPLALENIAAMVSNRIGRKIDKPVISGALQALEAKFNDATGQWSLSRPSADEDEDEDTAELTDGA
ncbi:DNA-directed RNA polymerase subunit alpha C-terminal domain-containing protein [Minwuia sp. IMCC3077]|uniref:DNA-directed RNA polymerase subunit alpha C-terminal domain-containing protein n=1 Tax=Minwuia sp. IMCC3077 TaxID=3040676 RepID=UPI00247932DF|nr:DNA-directed RNA polymerase subunit alpha C-terminal domain-containing protein [Minwuia sp. IMCC3077]